MVDERLRLYTDLARKYGGSTEAAVAHLESAESRLASLEEGEDDLSRLEDEADAVAISRARAGGGARRSAAARLRLGSKRRSRLSSRDWV